MKQIKVVFANNTRKYGMVLKPQRTMILKNSMAEKFCKSVL